MTRRMLVDAIHPEETRVVIADDSTIEEYDFSTSAKQQIKGNVYLAKVTRVEPSLQAAFVEYGGNRQGFLPFAEIHPQYYQIPIEDQKRLLAEQEEQARPQQDIDPADNSDSENGEKNSDNEHGDESVETIAEDDDYRARPSSDFSQHYRIQEVIKRGQIVLVQVIKEERGNKGAALTTYITLAGRYCVLMPNSSRQGGVSRKIGDSKDRKKLKNVLSDLDMPQGTSVIIRTAGAGRTKAEIKRDYEYLMRLWTRIREDTLSSTAPAIIFEESDIVKRAIRDLYDNKTEEILVEGEEVYKSAREFMKMLMPSHAARVKQYKGKVPLFWEYGIEEELAALNDPEVQTPSGGYVVINPTEALVAIDVNSGRATRERNIEETATKTNLEAAVEIARQMRLRDLAGLIVIDFIDMNDYRNRRSVERAMKDALRRDRAKIQINRISPFGLMEISRQRMRPSLTETNSITCPHCTGRGYVMPGDLVSLQLLRTLEHEINSSDSSQFTLMARTEVCMALLNQKREKLVELEKEYNVVIAVQPDDTLAAVDYIISDGTSERHSGSKSKDNDKRGKRKRKRNRGGRRSDENLRAEDTDQQESQVEEIDAEEQEEKQERRPRRRRGGRKRWQDSDEESQDKAASADSAEEGDDQLAEAADTGEEKEERRSRRRRGGRGGRRRNRDRDNEEAAAAVDDHQELIVPKGEIPETEEAEAPSEPEALEQPKKRTRRKTSAARAKEEQASEAPEAKTEPKKEARPKAEPKKAAEKGDSFDGEAQPAETTIGKTAANDAPPNMAPPVAEPALKKVDNPRRGWWKRMVEG